MNTNYTNTHIKYEAIYDMVKTIPYGNVITYKQLQNKLLNRYSIQFIVAALNKCVDAFIPTHRVIKSDRTIGSYSKGYNEKKRILNVEFNTKPHEYYA